MKKISVFIICAAILLLSVTACEFGIQSVNDYYGGTDSGEPVGKATISIDCSSVLQNYDKLDESLKSDKFVPKDGVILPPTEIDLYQSDCVFDVLNRVTKQHQIPLDYNNSGSTYVRGINNLYEFSCGSLSGWMLKVNGEFSKISSSDIIVADGDIIEWIYSCDLGRDVGDNYTGDDND